MTTTYIDDRSDRDVHLERHSERRPSITWASRTYVAAWLVGLALKPAGVTGADSEAALVGNYVDHRVASIAQVFLVHAVAALAALAFALGLARLAESSHRPRAAHWGRVAGWVIGITSLVQATIGVVMISTAGTVAGSTTRGLLVGVERLDAVKLVALAGLCTVGLVLVHVGLLERWTGRVAAAAVSCLIPAAVALSGIAPVLAPVAVPALILLLTWVGGVPFALRRTGA